MLTDDVKLGIREFGRWFIGLPVFCRTVFSHQYLCFFDACVLFVRICLFSSAIGTAAHIYKYKINK